MSLQWEQVSNHHECWWSENDWTLQIWHNTRLGYWFRAIDDTRTVYDSQHDGRYFAELSEAREACEAWVLGEAV